jgi:hypothetical protein|tara:strand:- start:113 stop:766 length:654 start_codon:yes stop_codon:yes gene_type:complete
MTLATYADLQDRIQAKFDDAVILSDAVLVDCIAMGESIINKDKRLLGSDIESTATDLSISSQSTSLPSDFRGQRRLYLDKDPNKPLTFYPPADFWSRHGGSQTGTPEIFTVEANNLIVAPVPASAETGKILYFQNSDIASSVPALFTKNPQLYVFAASVFAADELDDDAQVTKCAAMYDQLADTYEKGDKYERFPSGQLVQRHDVNPNFATNLRGTA